MSFQLRFSFFILVLFQFQIKGLGQVKPEHTFLKTGNISVADLKMSKYEPDTSASAVVLYDSGKSYFGSNLEHIFISHDRHVIIKILKKSGYYLADVALPLYRLSNSGKETLTNLKAYTYNLVDGQIVTEKLSKEGIFIEQTTENLLIQKFTLPNVKEGSIIEYTYHLQTPFLFQYQPWGFQREIPTLWSEYTAQIPDKMTYKILPQGQEPYVISMQKLITGCAPQNSNGTEYHWLMRNVPALKEEPYSNSIKNYVARLNFEFVDFRWYGYGNTPFHNSWDKITTQLLESEYFGLPLNRAGFLEEVVTPVIASANSPEQKMNLLYDFVKTHFKYNQHNRIYPELGLRKALKEKTGNCADINLLLIAMLRKAGLSAHPVILSTRDNGSIGVQTYPSTARFNYVIGLVKIDDKEYLLDATEPLALPNLLPVRCLNGQGRLIATQENRWIPLQPLAKATQICQANLVLSPDNALSGKIQLLSSGYSALNQRKAIQSEGEKKFIQRKASQSDYWDIGPFTIANPTASPEALRMEYEVKLAGAEQPANTIYLNPLQNEGLRENPFKPETRKFTIDFATAQEETYLFSYTIPAGYQVTELPQNKIIVLPENGGRFTYNITNTGQTVTVMSKLAIARPTFSPNEYPILKDFYNQIVAKHAEKIILKKMN